MADGPEKVFETENKQRIIQVFVPGKQVTLAHIIANPNPDIYKKLGVIGDHMGAIGIMTITPSEGAIIGADVATKAANVEVIFVDRFNGSLVIGGDVALFIQDATQERHMFSPGRAASFPIPVSGIVSKTDQATEKQVEQARELLVLAGEDPVFAVSAFTGEGIGELSAFLQD